MTDTAGLHQPQLATVFGGSGFVGRYVVQALVKLGYQVRVAVRRPDLALFLQPLGNVGQIRLMQANIRYRESVHAAVRGADLVINLAAVLAETGRQTFDAVHVQGAQSIAQAAKEEGIPLIHTSAIGADPESASGYGRSRGEGEQAVRDALKSTTIVRPSIVYGPEDEFFNRFAGMARVSPFLPLIGGGHTKFQPVYVNDLASAFARIVEMGGDDGKTYEIGGDQVLSFRECLEKMCEFIDRQPAMASIPFPVARAMGKLTGWLPGAPITYDQVLMLENDNVVSEEAIRQRRTLAGLGISPKTLDSILPSYLTRYRPHGQYIQRDA